MPHLHCAPAMLQLHIKSLCGTGGDMAQLVCSSPTCRVVLMYPRGASQVQCSICGTVNCAMAVRFLIICPGKGWLSSVEGLPCLAL